MLLSIDLEIALVSLKENKEQLKIRSEFEKYQKIEEE
jgi:hypothetical protein